MIELTAVAIVTLLAVVSPGADFAMITRNSILHGRSAGLLSAFGIALGVQLHVLYTMLGVGIAIRMSPELFTIIKTCGAVYLIYVGYKTFVDRPVAAAHVEGRSDMGPLAALGAGFLTNALNPKTTLFVVSVYTQVVDASTPLSVQIGYGLFMSVAHWGWFSLVSLFLSEPGLRARLLRRQVVLNRGIGLVLVLLGLGLMLAHQG